MTLEVAFFFPFALFQSVFIRVCVCVCMYFYVYKGHFPTFYFLFTLILLPFPQWSSRHGTGAPCSCLEPSLSVGWGMGQGMGWGMGWGVGRGE